MKISKYLMTILLTCLLIGCSHQQSFMFHGNTLVLTGKPKQQRLYLFYNTSKYPILLNRQLSKDPGAGAGWASQLDVKHWSAMTISRASFIMTCQKILPQYRMVTVRCQDVLKVQPINRFQASAAIQQGAGWLAEDLSLPQLKATIKSRGVNLLD